MSIKKLQGNNEFQRIFNKTNLQKLPENSCLIKSTEDDVTIIKLIKNEGRGE